MVPYLWEYPAAYLNTWDTVTPTSVALASRWSGTGAAVSGGSSWVAMEPVGFDVRLDSSPEPLVSMALVPQTLLRLGNWVFRK